MLGLLFVLGLYQQKSSDNQKNQYYVSQKRKLQSRSKAQSTETATIFYAHSLEIKVGENRRKADEH